MSDQARWAATTALMLVCVAAWAQTPDSGQPTGAETESISKEAEDEIEDLDIEEIEDGSETLAVPDSGDLTWTEIIGRMHPAAVHIPIGWVLLLTLWEAFVFLPVAIPSRRLGCIWLPRRCSDVCQLSSRAL